MPIYEFICQGCDKRFEELIYKQEDMGRLQCPACAGTDYRRIFSRFGMVSGGGAEPGLQTSSRSCSGCTAASCSTCK